MAKLSRGHEQRATILPRSLALREAFLSGVEMLNISDADVRGLANAYRATLDEGTTALKDSQIEQKVLLALVAASAAEAELTIVRQMKDGDRVAAPLTALLPYLSKGNVVGATLDKQRTVLVAQAKSLMLTGAFTQSAVLWWTTVGSVVLGFVLSSIATTGAATGHLVFTLIAGGISLGPLVYGISRMLSAGGGALQEGSARLLNYPRQVGQRALDLFNAKSSGTVVALGIPSTQLTATRSLVFQTRATAGLIVYGAAVIAAAAVMYFLISAYDGYMDAQHEKQRQVTCQLSPYFCQHHL